MKKKEKKEKVKDAIASLIASLRESVDKLTPVYSLGEEVSFYLPSSLEVNRGTVVGFFLSLDEGSEDKGTYYYQLKYYKEMKDESKKMFLGTVTEEETGRDDAKVNERFKAIRLERIDKAIEQGKIELGGAKANTDFHKGVQKEVEDELVRLKKLK